MLTSRACLQDPSFLRRQERALTRSAIPVQAGTRAHAPGAATHTPPFPNSSLPPSRGEARWGVGAPSQRQPLSNTPNRLSHHSRTPSCHSRALPVIPAPFPSFLRRQEPPATHTPPFPNSSLPPSRGEVRWGVGAPSQHQPLSNTPNRLPHHSRAPPRHSRAPPPSLPRHSRALPVIPAQAGTPTSPQPCYHTPRRTKVRSMPTSSNTDHPRAQTTAPHAAAALRTTPNKPEHRRTPRPDRTTP